MIELEGQTVEQGKDGSTHANNKMSDARRPKLQFFHLSREDMPTLVGRTNGRCKAKAFAPLRIVV